MWIDYLFYKKWVFTPLTFFRVNVAENISLYYGGHPFHFYLTQAIPLVLLTFLPLVALGVSMSNQLQRKIFHMSLFVVFCLSCLGHKEFRFLMPLVSPMLIYAGHALSKLSIYKSHRLYTPALGILLGSNMLLAMYLGTVHKQGVVKVTDWLRNEAGMKRVASVLFLMPCHSTPYYSRVVHDIPMRFITCEPPLGIR
jgi:phosphatidylinositol glycan class B